jgi:hypothetical protein
MSSNSLPYLIWNIRANFSLILGKRIMFSITKCKQVEISQGCKLLFYSALSKKPNQMVVLHVHVWVISFRIDTCKLAIFQTLFTSFWHRTELIKKQYKCPRTLSIIWIWGMRLQS